MTLEDLFALPQYSLPQPQKERALLPLLNALTAHHRANCREYRKLLSVLRPGGGEAADLNDVPYLPVGLFKSHRLMSIPEDRVFRTLASSGTTGQAVSRVFLDDDTARLQTRALSRILTHVLGPERLPMMLVESRSILNNRKSFNARASGVLGLMNFGRNHFFALDENMQPDERGVRDFLSAYGAKPFIIFGFTYMIWRCLAERIAAGGLDLSQGILIHGGGWKKLEQLAISNAEFKRRLREAANLTRVYNFYGMVEQVGSVFLEGEDGLLYAPSFADVIVRDPRTLRALPAGSVGVIQVVSTLPHSYPGHSILTEDLGVVYDVDANRCGRLGKAFSVIGRVPNAELRGCSDVYAAPAA